jgi:hypothetical protein
MTNSRLEGAGPCGQTHEVLPLEHHCIRLTWGTQHIELAEI